VGLNGQEDASWGFALRCLAGPPAQGDADLIHLFHPPAERMSRKHGSNESWRLFHRYRLALHNPDLMRTLIKEARDALEPDQSSLRSDPSLDVGHG
jgi:hypothetical protein